MLISSHAQKALKVLHLLTVAFWTGGGLAIITLSLAGMHAQSGEELYGILKSLRFVSVFVVVYLGAFGSFFTGLAYSLCTHRGFFRFRWVVIKWILTVLMIALGYTMLGRLGSEMFETVSRIGLAALEDPDYLRARRLHLVMVSLHLGMLFVATILSVYKPGEDTRPADSLRPLRPVRRIPGKPRRKGP